MGGMVYFRWCTSTMAALTYNNILGGLKQHTDILLQSCWVSFTGRDPGVRRAESSRGESGPGLFQLLAAAILAGGWVVSLSTSVIIWCSLLSAKISLGFPHKDSGTHCFCCCYLVINSCLTLCNPKDYSLPGSSLYGISRQEYWSGLPFPSPGVFLTEGSNPKLLNWQADTLLLSHQGRP